MKDPELRDNPPNLNPHPNPYDRQHPSFHAQLHLYDRQHADVHRVLRDMRTLVDSYGKDKVLIGEIEISPWDTWRLYYGEQLDEFHIPFNFQLIETPWDAQAVCDSVEALEAALPAGAWPNYVLGNHDRPRLATRYGNEKVRTAALLLLTLRGTPTLYYGDELGMRDARIAPDRLQDPLGRDGTRTPMQWDSGPNAGFCMANSTPWLPIADDYQTVNVDVELGAEQSVLALYRRLLTYRKTSAALRAGTYRRVWCTSHCYAYLREANGNRVLTAINFSSQEQVIDLSIAGPGKIVISTHLDRVERPDLTTLSLRGDEGVIVELDA